MNQTSPIPNTTPVISEVQQNSDGGKGPGPVVPDYQRMVSELRQQNQAISMALHILLQRSSGVIVIKRDQRIKHANLIKKLGHPPGIRFDPKKNDDIHIHLLTEPVEEKFSDSRYDCEQLANALTEIGFTLSNELVAHLDATPGDLIPLLKWIDATHTAMSGVEVAIPPKPECVSLALPHQPTDMPVAVETVPPIIDAAPALAAANSGGGTDDGKEIPAGDLA